MRYGIFSALLLVLFCSAGAFAQKPKTITYKSYCNPRFEYCVSYPAGILVPEPEAGNGDGRRFWTKDQQVEMMVYGRNNALDQTIAEMYAQEAADKAGHAVSYKLKKNTWFVVSGIENDKVFYQKTMFRRDQILTFRIEYPRNQRKLFDTITARIAASFK